MGITHSAMYVLAGQIHSEYAQKEEEQVHP